jgi:pimeloyl-ACP methyl ester carboxylesterase
VHSADATERIRASCVAVKVPMLLTTSERDPFDGANNVRTWGKGLPHVVTKVVPGADHGMAIYHTVRRDVVAFVKQSIAAPTRVAGRPGLKGRRRRR